MSDYCKHGLAMDIPCRKCGRTRVVEVPNFEAKKNSFTDSIDKLERTVRHMQQELAAPAPRTPPPPMTEPAPGEPSPAEPAAAPPAPLGTEPAPDEPGPEPAPPASAPERFPWQRG